MNNSTEPQSDFYIGWQEKAPTPFVRHSRRFVIGIAMLVIMAASLLVIFQRPFATSIFEFGTLSEWEGQLSLSPVPMLRQEKESILLVGAGKHGAEATLQEIQALHGKLSEGMWVQLKGTRISYDGKTALELTEGTDAYIGASVKALLPKAEVREFGRVALKGEILDPKCALGVMIPAEGKPHRSCAVRCIAGGIPPLLRMIDAEGNRNYALVLGPNNEPINQQILPYVADQILICGELRQEGDWLVLQTNPEQDIQRLLPYGISTPITSCGS